MPSTNIGEVNVGVDLTVDNVHERLHESVREKLAPALNDLNRRIDQSRRAIDAIDSKPFVQAAKEAKVAADAQGKVASATHAARRAQDQLNTSVEKARKDKAALRAEEKKADKEMQERGRISERTQTRLLDLTNKLKLAEDEVETRRENYANKDRAREQARIADRQRMREEIHQYLADQKQVHEDEIKSYKRSKREILREAKRASDGIIATERKTTAATATEIRNRERQARDLANAQIAEAKRAAREQRRVAREAYEKSAFNTLAHFGRRAGGVRIALSPIGISAILAGLSQVITVASTAAAAVGAIPAVLGAAGVAAGTVKLSMLGLEDAIKSAFDPDVKPDDLAKAMAKLTPAAQEFVTALKDIAPEFENLQRAMQETFFDGIGDQLKGLADEYQPLLDGMFLGVSDSLNDIMRTAADALMQPETQKQLQGFADNLVMAFEKLEPAIEPLVEAFAALMDAGGESLPIITDGIANAAIAFSNFLTEAQKSGQLQEWIQSGIDAVGDLLEMIQLIVVEFFSWHETGKTVMPSFKESFESLIKFASEFLESLAIITGDMNAWIPILDDISQFLEMMNSINPDWPFLSAVTSLLNPLKLVKDVLDGIIDGWNALAKVVPGLPEVTSIAGIEVGGAGSTTTYYPGADHDDPRLPAPVRGPRPDFFNFPEDPARPGRPAWNGIGAGRAGINPFGPELTGWGGDLATASERDLLEDIRDQYNPENFDPYSAIGGVQNMPGMPGRAPMSVTVENMPSGGMMPRIPGMPGMPGGGGPVNAGLQAALQAAGLPADAIRLIQAFSQVEGTNPAGIPNLGFTDDQIRGMGMDPGNPQSFVTALMNQFRDRAGVAGAFPTGGTDRQMAEWIARVVGQAGLASDWQGNAQPQDYVDRVVAAMSGPATAGAVSLPGSANLMGAHPGFQWIADIARNNFGLNVTSGLRDWAGTASGRSYHLTGEAIDLSNGSDSTPEMTAFAHWLAQNLGPHISELIYTDDMGGVNLLNGKPHDYSAGTDAAHRNHIHLAIKDEVLRQLGGGVVPKSFQDGMFATNGPMVTDPATGKSGFFQVDQQRVWEAENRVREAEMSVQEAMAEVAALEHAKSEGMDVEVELRKAHNDLMAETIDLQKANMDLDKAERGTFKSRGGNATGVQGLSIDDFAYGDPRRAMVGALSGLGMSANDIGAIMGAAGRPIGEFAGHVGSTIAGFPLPGPMGMPGTPTAPSTDIHRLAQERNPMFFAQAAGFNVPDYTRAGGGASAQNLAFNGGPAGDATGRMYSDTAALIDRTFTNMDASAKARHDQMITVLNAVRERLSEEVLGPVLEDSVAGGFAGMGNGAAESIGTALGHAAGPIIAQYVAAAIPSGGSGNSSGTGVGGLVTNLTGTAVDAAAPFIGPGAAGFLDFGGMDGYNPVPSGYGPLGGLYDEGGLWPSGTFGTNLSGSPERVLSPSETALFDAGLLGGWNLLPQQQHFATMPGQDVTDFVGGDWFGVSQIPILGALFSLLVGVLLKLLNIEIEARDTLTEISGDFRNFRGDFMAFDASGRLRSDTSGLVDRTGSSEQAAADERIRILKIVIEGLIKFIIEKLIVPISKAVAQTAIQAGATAASGAISGAGAIVPGGTVASGAVGSVVGSAISSAGSAATDIIADVWSNLATSIASVAVEGVGDALTGLPIIKMFLGGNSAASVFDPINNVITGIMGGVTSLFTGLFGGVADLFFDSGGMAYGAGLMPKATIQPERVLSPRQTVLFERMVSSLERGAQPGTKTTSVHAPITMVVDHERAGDNVQNKLLELMA